MYMKFLPSEYVLRYKNGKIVNEGIGLSFFCLKKNTAVMCMPTSVIADDFIFEQHTKDFQTVSVQGQISYRIADYKKLAAAMNFTIHLGSKGYYDEPLQKLSKRMIHLTQVMIQRHINAASLTQALLEEKQTAGKVLADLRQADEPQRMGIEITGFSILAVLPTKETLRALEAQTREQVLKCADDALYERRNASIEQERKVKENELNTDISVEQKKKQIKESEISTKKMLIEKESEFEMLKAQNAAKCEKIKMDTAIEIEKQRKELAQLKFENAKKQADAQAYQIKAVMEAYNALDKDVLVALATLNLEPEKMIAKAFETLAGNSEKIGSLNITPDLLESLTAKA